MKFGVYTLANDNVLDQLDALYNSFRRYNPTTPIVVIPFDDEIVETRSYCQSRSIAMVDAYLTECDAIGRQVTTGEEKGYKIYRKFTAFCGEFDIFAFIDSDTLVLGEISDLAEIYAASNMDFLFYSHAAADRNFGVECIKQLAELTNRAGREGFNAGFFLTRRNVFSLAFLEGLSARGDRLQKILTRGHEQAFLNYAIAVSGAQAGILHRFARQYAVPWQSQKPIVECPGGFCYASDPEKLPIRILHWGGPLWGKGPNAELVQMFSTKPSHEAVQIPEMKSPLNLTHLANHHGSDKGTAVGNAHNYTAFYSFLFEQFRFSSFSMLEIGLLRGGPELTQQLGRVAHDCPSIRMWLDYFPSATCFGIDVSDFSNVLLDRFTFFQCDLSFPDDVRQVAAKLPTLRVVIDDASHASFHQHVAFAQIFPRVEPNGFYVIEDLEWQPPHYEESLPQCAKMIDVFLGFLTTGELEIAIASEEERRGLAASISQVFIYRLPADAPQPGGIKMIAIQKR